MRRHLVQIILFATLIWGAPAWGQQPAPFPEFTFKRVGVPKPGATRRITVQIDPAAAPAAATAAPPPQAAPDLASGYEWFWDTVSPALDGGGPANLTRALSALAQKDGLDQPRLQVLQNIAATHGPDILRATVGTDISPALVLALISVESAGRADATSTAGAQGLMQLIPATADRFGVTDSSDPAQNIRGGVAYLSWLMREFDRDPILALAGYNAGENAVTDHGGVPPFAETRAYVPKVLGAWQVARGLCNTPPELVTDGCVFAVKGTPTNG